MIRRTYLKMTGPQILASISSMLCLLIDSIVISRFLGVDAMSAYGLVSPMIIVVNACILMISCGAQVSAAASLGRGDMEELGAGYSSALAGAAGISLVIMLTVFTAARPVCGLLGANRSNVPPDVSEMTEQYLKGYFIGTPFFFLVQLATPYLQTMGKRKDLMKSVICMTVLVISLFVWKKVRKVTLSAEAYSYLGSGFGADPGDILDFTVTDRQGAAAASENMRIFYLEKGVYAREAMLVSLCTEEIAMNILAHGFTADRRKHTLEIRTVYKGNCLTLHFRDNCVLFDPTEYAALHWSDGPDHIGLRMVMRMVDEAVYVNSLGLNNLFFTVHIG